MTRNEHIRWLVKPGVFLASVAPSAWLTWAALIGRLSANPLADLTNETGVWALRFLCMTLMVTPVRRLSGWNDAIRSASRRGCVWCRSQSRQPLE